MVFCILRDSSTRAAYDFSLFTKCLLKHRMMRGKDADRTRRYTVHRRAKSTHNRTVTLHSEVGGNNVTDSTTIGRGGKAAQ